MQVPVPGHLFLDLEEHHHVIVLTIAKNHLKVANDTKSPSPYTMLSTYYRHIISVFDNKAILKRQNNTSHFCRKQIHGRHDYQG